jgi:hypothetical protein
MKTTRFFVTTVFVSAFMLLTPQAHAQKVVDTKVTRLSDTITMYTLTYEFGFLNADLWMPLYASRKADTNSLGYQSAATNSSALVLSDATITKQNMYYVPKGKRATFKLMVLEEQVGPETREVKRVQVTNLPHIIQRDGEKQMERKLTEAELEKFIVWNN